MDRNTIIGLVLIFLVLIGFQYLSRPSEQELREIEMRRDSIARVEQERIRLAAEAEHQAFDAIQNDSTASEKIERVFSQDSVTHRHIILENNLIRLHVNTKGGRIDYVELKEYVTHDSLPLVLWQPENSVLGLRFYANNMDINTEDFVFTPSTQESFLVADSREQTLSMRLYTGDDKYLEYVYSLSPDKYTVDFDIRTHNLNDVIATNTPFLTMFWGNNMPQLEKSKEFENRYTGIYYNFLNDGIEELSNNADNKKETLTTKVKWIAFKQQFFSSVLIAGESFNDVILSSEKLPQDGYLKNTFTEIPLAYAGRADENYNMQFYFGPNSFSILKEYGSDIELPKLVNLGWKWVAWFNRYLVIPIFNFLENHVTNNYG
ncbi:MAG: membrane protein insertase YidC, partial [Odoribacter sp.]|nr:membrane protein insertase YidC [Odoribacter sp.]